MIPHAGIPLEGKVKYRPVILWSPIAAVRSLAFSVWGKILHLAFIRLVGHIVATSAWGGDVFLEN